MEISLVILRDNGYVLLELRTNLYVEWDTDRSVKDILDRRMIRKNVPYGVSVCLRE